MHVSDVCVFVPDSSHGVTPIITCGVLPKFLPVISIVPPDVESEGGAMAVIAGGS